MNSSDQGDVLYCHVLMAIKKWTSHVKIPEGLEIPLTNQMLIKDKFSVISISRGLQVEERMTGFFS
jgi:hypothetical protein